MADLRTLAEAAIAARGTDTWTSNALVEAEEAFCGAANPRAVIGLLDTIDQYTEIHARMRTILGGTEGEAIAVENLARDVVMECDRLRAENEGLRAAAAKRWMWTVAEQPGGGAILSYRAPGHPGFALIASALPRKDGMLAVSVLGQKRTAAADLPAALATIRAVLGADVPEIPNERSES